MGQQVLKIPDRLFRQLLFGNVEFDRLKKRKGELYPAEKFDDGTYEKGCLPGGTAFEIFMFSRSTDNVRGKYKEYADAFQQAIVDGVDHQALSGEKCFSKLLFSLVKSLLPTAKQSDLRMFVTVGSSFDAWHGVDLVFTLGDYYVCVDSTMNAFSDQEERFEVLRFTHYQLSQREALAFATKITRRLIMRTHMLPHEVHKLIKKKDKQARTSNN
jgi:hypothetical protein